MADEGLRRLQALLTKRPREDEVIDLCASDSDADDGPTPSKRSRIAAPVVLSSPARKSKGKAREVLDVDDDATSSAPPRASTSSASSSSSKTVECPICTLHVPLSKAIQCSQGCQFCPTCIRAQVDLITGQGKTVVECETCSAPISQAELVRCVPLKTLDRLGQLDQRKQLRLAGATDIDQCPFCDFVTAVSDPKATVLRCSRPTCGIVSCRQCSRLEHPKRTCQQVADGGAASDKEAAIKELTEAMSEAASQRCDHCRIPYIKDGGCDYLYVQAARKRVGDKLIADRRLTAADVASLDRVLNVPESNPPPLRSTAPPANPYVAPAASSSAHGPLPWAGGAASQPTSVFGRFGKAKRAWQL